MLQLVVEGPSDKEIAATLGISRSTASDHVASIRVKLGAPSRASASALAVRSGLLTGHRTPRRVRLTPQFWGWRD